MPEPQRASDPLKWILLGCGGLLLLGVLGAAGLGVLAYRGTKSLMTEFSAVSDAGAAAIRVDPTVVKELGPIKSVEHRFTNTKITYNNGHGSAHFTYGLIGEKGSADAAVWMSKPAGADWSLTGALLTTPDNRLIKVGSPPETPKINWKVD